MTCQQAQMNLSLYLYGELDFAQEEQLEQHLSECALCERALRREKTWHTTLNSEREDAPLDLLSQCRRDLRNAISSSERTNASHASWSTWLERLGFSATPRSMRVAVASFLVMVGFGAARWMDRNGVPGSEVKEISQMGFLGSSTARIRDIQPRDNDRVRIIFDEVRPGEITGRVADDAVRQLLLAAAKDPTDPGIRVDSVDILKNQGGGLDVRDALIYSVRHDSNAAVRFKALEGLRRFAADQTARDTLKFVLEHDDNPGLRSEIIDVLAPANEPLQLNPDLVGILQQIAGSEREDDYIRMRSIRLLRAMQASPDIY
jgi:Putative zinc-finger/HEAT repeats